MTGPDEHFHALLCVTVPCFDEQTLAAVSEVLSRACTGLAIEHKVEPMLSIDWPHRHHVEDDEDQDVSP